MQAEAGRRVQAGVFFQIAAICFLAFAYGSESGQTWFFSCFLASAFFLVSIRGISYILFVKKVEYRQQLYLFQMTITSLIALSYGLLAADTILHYRIFNSPVIMVLFFSIGMSTAVLNSLAPSLYYQRIYLILIGLPPIVACFDSSLDPVFRNMGIVYIIYFSYLFYCGRLSSKDLTASYKAEIVARRQTKTLQEVINLVPGFVALSDSLGHWDTISRSFGKYKHSNAFQEICKQFRLGTATRYTREITWFESDEEHSYILSMQKFNDLSMLVVGIPAEEIFEMRRELDVQRSKAEFSARLATLGEMAGGIAHEVNNPLAVIIGICSQISSLLKQPHPDLQKIGDKIDKVSKTSFRINKIITGLQSFSRQSDNDPMTPIKLKQIIEDTLELCRERFYQNSIELSISEIPDIEISVRSVQISQVLMNLLNNSFDAVKKIPEPRVNLSCEETDTEIKIYVSDNGSGIPSVIADKIFEPFFTTKEVGKGTGLGLSISRSILLSHQGELQLLRDRKQTTFCMSLPKIRKS